MNQICQDLLIFYGQDAKTIIRQSQMKISKNLRP